MDYKERYNKLLEKNRSLEKELEALHSKSEVENLNSNDMIFRIFHSTSHIMAIIKVDSGQIVDINEAFLKNLGYEKEDVIGRTPDDIHLFVDFQETNKYIKLIPRLNKIKDYAVTLSAKNGDKLQFLFSSETVQIDNEAFLFTVFEDISLTKNKKIKESQGTILDEIFNTVSSYLALFSYGEDNRFYIIDLNSKVEEVEFLSKNDVIGKCIDDTILARRHKLVELLHHLRITGDSHKLAASHLGDDSEGYYMGFILTSGNFVITWEPGLLQKNLEEMYKQSLVFEKLADLLPEMVYEIDLSGKILYGNSLGLKFFGFTKDDIQKGILISDVFPENYLKMIENLKSLKSPDQTTSNEYIARKKDGTLIPVVTHSFATFHGDRITGYRGVVTDISKQKEYENQIIREKAFLEHLIDSTPEAIAILDLAGRITMVNKEFTKLFGFTMEEAVNRFIDDLILPEDLREESVSLDVLSSCQHQEVRQTIRKDKQGKRIQVSLNATAIVINNKPVAFLGIYRDITLERKNQFLQEVLFNISTAALRQFDIKDLFPIIVKEIGKIWDTNNFFIALYDKNAGTLSLPYFADEKDNFKEISAEKTITGWIIKNNKSVLLKEDDLKLMEESGNFDLVGTPCKVWMGVPLRIENEVMGAMCLQDYSDENKYSQDDLGVLDFIANQISIAIQRRRMLDNLIQARKKAEEAANTKQQFMSTMSHEIRTPLNEVIGITNLLLQGEPRSDQMDLIKTLRFSGDHLLTLVNDVLDYNKIESGKIIFEKSPFNLNDFLDDIMRSYSFRSKSKNLDFKIIKTNNLPVEVIGDSIRLNQILSNLLSNALKFTQKGGISVYVTELARTGSQVNIEFRISDSGIGIPKEKHIAIFESFTQAESDTTRFFGGTGLGLAICKNLVDLQNGTLTLESVPGKGSTFSFILSFGIPEKDTIEITGKPAETFTGLEGKSVLVAEDNKINFFVANKFLTGWGIKVTHAENGKIALECLEKEVFDLIIMDLHMPVIDGIEATRIIRNSDNPDIKDIPIVALTAAIMSERHHKIDKLQINDFVLKPFKPHDLFEKILKHIR